MNVYSDDIKEKRAKFIEINGELNQEFSCPHPEAKSKINRIYYSSFPGSVLWDRDDHEQLVCGCQAHVGPALRCPPIPD